MEFIEWLALLAMTVVGCFCFVFMFWRAITLMRKRRGGAMSRGRIVWLLLGGLSVILTGCVPALAVWHGSEVPRDFVLQAGLLFWFAWGVTEIAIALRAAFAGKRA